MATTPSGNPAWVRTNDETNYGGHVDLRNYNDIPIVNPKTDVGAEHLARIAADMAAIARMANFAEVHFTLDSGSNAPTVNYCRLMTGVYTGTGYSGTSPPTGFPKVLGVSNGVADVKFTGVYQDAYSVSSTFQPVFSGASIANYSASFTGAGAAVFSYASGTDTVRVRVETSAGAGIPNASINVWVS